MFFLVLGLADAAVRRIPWVSIAFAGLLVVVSLGIDLRPAPKIPANQQVRLGQILDFREAHPEVKMPADFRQTAPTLARLITMGSWRRSRLAVSPDQARQDQAAFDALLERALAPLRTSAWDRWGLVPEKGVAQPGWVTHLFLVPGLFSLFLAVLMIYIVGPVLEDVYGRPIFAGLLLAGALVSGAIIVTLVPHSARPFLGPGDALGVCFGAFTVRFRNRPLKVFWWFLFRGGVAQISAWIWAAVWLVLVFLGAGSLTLLHVGGLAAMAGPPFATFGAGVAIAVLMARYHVEARYVDPVVEGAGFQQHPAVLEATDALARGDVAGARARYQTALKAEPRNIDALLGLIRLEVDASDPAAAHRHLDRLLTGCLGRRDLDTAGLAIGQLGSAFDPDRLRPATAYKVGAEMGDRLDAQLRAQLLASGGRAEGLLGAKSALAAAELELETLGRPANARAIAEQLLGRPGLDPAFAERARAIVAAAPPAASGLELGGGAAAGAGASGLELATEPAPSGLALATDPAPAATRRILPSRFAGRVEGGGYRVFLPDGRAQPLPLTRIREVAAGVLDRFPTPAGDAANVVILDLVLARDPTAVRGLRFDSRAMGLETLFEGMAPQAAFRALVGELFGIPGIALRPAGLARGLPRFADLAAFEAAAYA